MVSSLNAVYSFLQTFRENKSWEFILETPKLFSPVVSVPFLPASSSIHFLHLLGLLFQTVKSFRNQSLKYLLSDLVCHLGCLLCTFYTGH